ncbi:MAG TPA: MaoC/PaaZ C-terminal domain-containing protein [Acidimicrobiales bacterium]|nr:MaoC/PaaZ C-terminal domain-containing protein [Acidimicrobiales bacterium]
MSVIAPQSLTVGAQAEERTYPPLTRTDIVRYAGASGDFTPLHHDQEFAEKAGYPTVFSIGMYQAGLLAGFAADWLGAENVRRFAARFREQVWPGDELTCAGTVSAVEDTAEGRRVDVELECRRQTGGVAITATATFVLPA